MTVQLAMPADLESTTWPTAATPAPVLLPDVPGCVHGIVALDPPTVQCDGCAWTYSDRTFPMALINSGIVFHRLGRRADPRRLCSSCRDQEWGEDQ